MKLDPTRPAHRGSAARHNSFAAAFATVIVALAAACRAPQRSAVVEAAPSSAGAPQYAGRASCSECHADVSRDFEGSDHDRAMQPADAKSVLGNFNGARFEAHGLSTRFDKRDGKYFVTTDGPDGRTQEFPVAYTFGVRPLQQYLIELPGGRLQALGVAWDARPAAAGGGRWFHLYPGERVDHTDVLHWTGAAQNWNFMCAECHSTGVRKNYDAAADRFATAWSEIDVSCEACHGPASRHLLWARHAAEGSGGIADPLKGFDATLRDTSGGDWSRDASERTAHRTQPRDPRVQVDTCGRCHARRAQIADWQGPGQPLGQTHLVSLLEEGLYHDDGSIDAEVYEYGSFLQSKMFHKGVVCADCHDPHAARLRADGNAVCGRCHDLEIFDAKEHHGHSPGKAGAHCVDCHMPQRTYMVVDPRRDHSFRIPRPDLSAALGTPNACNDCHREQSPQWAADQVSRWRKGAPQRPFHFAEALHAARAWRPEAAELLLRVAGDAETPAIARATAIGLLPGTAGSGALDAVARAARDPDSLVRQAAADALEGLDESARSRIGPGLLRDPIRSVRIQAVLPVAAVPADRLPAADRAALDAAVTEYRAVQAFNADRAEAWVNLGTLEAILGRARESEAAYKAAIRKQPMFVPASIDLADLYRAQGREPEAEGVLRDVLTRVPGNAEARHALGLALVRQGRKREALGELSRAVTLAPDNPRFAYVYGVALHDAGDARGAQALLRDANRRFPGYAPIGQALQAFAGGPRIPPGPGADR